MRARYVTLSHCWGGRVNLATTTETLETHKKGIPLPTMPKTFADAVEITRRLGIRYLWVDSLCILQNSKRDWEEQLAVMADIYTHGHVNIAARPAANAAVGCFMHRPPTPPACELGYIATDGSGIKGSMCIRSPSFRPEKLRDSPLDRRGWVLQERILSPRIVYFGAQQMYWECVSATHRQDGKHHDVQTDDLGAAEGFKDRLDVGRITAPQPGSHLNPGFWQWYKVVNQYTERSLTFATDMLPAISGNGRQFQKKLGSNYVAGLWEEDLIYGLAWYKRNPRQVIEGVQLPFWSWARVTGETGFASHVNRLPMLQMAACCVLLDFRYELASLSPFEKW
jgi:hypothetical protein